MHPSALPEHIIKRVVARRGRLNVFTSIVSKRTALVVVDMQNTFCAPGGVIEVPVARDIVPNINRLAAAVREFGGLVAWVQMTIKDEADWPVFLTDVVPKDVSNRVLAGLQAGSEGHKLWKEMLPDQRDLIVFKKRFSAFLPTASDLTIILKSRGIDTVIVVGTLTNVCCEASARDAAMQDFKTIIVSDGNAGLSDDEHMATLVTFIQSFGDVRPTEELIEMLRLGQS